MKTTAHILAFILVTAACGTGFIHAQGSLTPPAGPPGPVMKTLDQIEARTPLVDGQYGVSVNNSTGTITISQPGNYYLTKSLAISTVGAHGIVISNNNVNLDLNGFSLICTGVNGGDAISMGNSTGCRIRNGSIIGGTSVTGNVYTLNGWNRGISRTDESADGAASDLLIRGVRDDAIIGRPVGIGPMFQVVERCQVEVCGGDGIFSSSVIDCQVRDVGGCGISTWSSFGTDSFRAGIVSNCYARTTSSTAPAIDAGYGTVSNSRGFAIGGTGIAGEVVINSSGSSSSGIGLSAWNAQNCLGNTTSGAYGISASGTANGCRGYNASGGIAITAGIAIGCTSGGGSISSPQKHLGTP